MRTLILAAALLAACPAALPARAQTFLAPAQVDLLLLLPPYPPTGSPTEQAEMQELLARAGARTPERIAQAAVDVDESVFTMFGGVMGPGFAPGGLPLATRLFERLGDTEEAVNTPVKKGFGRTRPYVANAGLPVAIQPSRSPSYPSGHSTRGTIMGVVLAAMVPERRPQIFARIVDYGESRLWGGVHYPSDVAAGRVAGVAVDAVLFNDPAFQAAYGPARAEVRAVLGLP